MGFYSPQNLWRDESSRGAEFLGHEFLRATEFLWDGFCLGAKFLRHEFSRTAEFPRQEFSQAAKFFRHAF